METADTFEEFFANRSPELREKLVLQSVPLVHYLLARMGITQERGSDYEDLAHQGLMGLIEAVDRFDPKFNTRFTTLGNRCNQVDNLDAGFQDFSFVALFIELWRITVDGRTVALRHT